MAYLVVAKSSEFNNKVSTTVIPEIKGPLTLNFGLSFSDSN